jgi:hypothetical protein
MKDLSCLIITAAPSQNEVRHLRKKNPCYLNLEHRFQHHRGQKSRNELHKQEVLLKHKKGKAIPVTDRGRPQGCETSRFTHFLDNRVTDGGGVVSLMRRPSFTPQEDSWY